MGFNTSISNGMWISKPDHIKSISCGTRSNSGKKLCRIYWSCTVGYKKDCQNLYFRIFFLQPSSLCVLNIFTDKIIPIFFLSHSHQKTCLLSTGWSLGEWSWINTVMNSHDILIWSMLLAVFSEHPTISLGFEYCQSLGPKLKFLRDQHF